MPDTTIATTPAAAARVQAAMVGLYPIPRDAQGQPAMSEANWTKQAIINLIRRDVLRWERQQARQTASDAVDELSGSDIS